MLKCGKVVAQAFDDGVYVDMEKTEVQMKQRMFPPTILLLSQPKEFLFEEIFGPVFPVFRVDSFDQFVELYKAHYHDQVKPLSGTLFSNDQGQIRLFKDVVSAGALTIN